MAGMSSAAAEGDESDSSCCTQKKCSWHQVSRRAFVFLSVALVGERFYLWKKRKARAAFWESRISTVASPVVTGVFYENADIPAAYVPERSMSSANLRNVMIGGKVRIGVDEFELAGMHLCPVGTGNYVYTGSLQVRFNGGQTFSIVVSSLGSLEANGFSVPQGMVPDLIEKTAPIVGDFPPPSRVEFERLLPRCAETEAGNNSDLDKERLVRIILAGIHHSLRSRTTARPTE